MQIILTLHQNTLGEILELFTKKINAAIFISGTGTNMREIIRESRSGVLKNIVNIKTVFSDNSNAKGLEIARNCNVNVFTKKQYYKNREKGEKNIVSELKKMDVNFIILAGYMRVLSKYFIDVYRNRIINIHPADNDLYKGINGYLWAYENKLDSSKITIHLVNEELDSGRVLSKESFLIPKNSTLGEIEKIGLKLEHEIYSKVIKNYVLKELL